MGCPGVELDTEEMTQSERVAPMYGSAPSPFSGQVAGSSQMHTLPCLHHSPHALPLVADLRLPEAFRRQYNKLAREFNVLQAIPCATQALLRPHTEVSASPDPERVCLEHPLGDEYKAGSLSNLALTAPSQSQSGRVLQAPPTLAEVLSATDCLARTASLASRAADSKDGSCRALIGPRPLRDLCSHNWQPCVPPVACTKLPAQRPSEGPGRKSGGFPSLRLQLSSRVGVFPEQLDRPELRNQALSHFRWLTAHRATGAVIDDSYRDRYVIFATDTHMELRRLPIGFTINDLIADILGTRPNIRSVRFLQERLPGLPPVQVAVQQRSDPDHVWMLPVDLRPAQGRICTLAAALPATADGLTALCIHECPASRLPPGTFHIQLPSGIAFATLHTTDAPDYVLGTPPEPQLPLGFDVGAEGGGWDDLVQTASDPTTTSTTHMRGAGQSERSALELALLQAHVDGAPPLPAELRGVELCPQGLQHTGALQLLVTQVRATPGLSAEDTSSGTTDVPAYTVFVRGREPIQAQGSIHWTLQDYCCGATLFAEAPLRRLQMLTSPLPGLPVPQFVVTSGSVAEGSSVIPVDMRAFGQGITALLLRPGMTRDSIIAHIIAAAPALRPDLTDPLSSDRYFVCDAGHQVLPHLPSAPHVVQWLRLCLRPVPPGHLDPLTLSIEDTEGDEVLTLLQTASHTALQTLSHLKQGSHAPEPEDPPEEGRDPPALLGRLLPSPIAGLCAGAVQVLPDYLSSPESLGREVLHSSWGGREAAEAGQFTVFDVEHHARALARGTKSTLHECIALALQATSFLIVKVRVLTVPVPGLPLPQIVLHRANDPAPLDTLVWDLRAIQRPIRTVAHVPGTDLNMVLQQVDASALPSLGLTSQWQAGSIVILDALGQLEGVLPEDFDIVQHARAEATMWVEAAPLVLERWPPRGPVSHTTSTTTAMQAQTASRPPRHTPPPFQALQLRVVRGRHSEQAVVELPCTQLDRALDHLLHRVELATGDFHSHNQIMLAKAQPHPSTDVYEAIFLVLEGPRHIMSLFDTRHLGPTGSLFSAHSPCATRCEATVTPDLLSGGWSLFVNGAPVHLCQRNIDHGDYLQISPHGMFPQHVPTTVIMEACPLLEAYAWGLSFPVVRSARLRREQAGFHRHLEGRCLVLGPEHAPAAFRTKHAYVASHSEMREAVTDLVGFPARDCAIVRSTEQFRNTQITIRFASVARGSTLSTVFLPAWGWEDHFVVLLVPAIAEDLGSLPIGHYMQVVQEPRWRQGMVLRLYLIPTTTSTTPGAVPCLSSAQPSEPSHTPSSPAVSADADIVADSAEANTEATFLLQTKAQYWAGPAGASVATPFGRRRVPVPENAPPQHQFRGGSSSRSADAAAAPDLQQTQQRRPVTLTFEPERPRQAKGILFGLEPDTLDYVFGPYGRQCLQRERPPTRDLHPAAAAFLCQLPNCCLSQPLEAMQIIADGSFEPSQPAARAGWAVIVIGLQNGQWGWEGYLATSCQPEGDPATLGVAVDSAFQTELAALTFALTLCQAIPIPAAIFYDCTSAGDIATDCAAPAQANALAMACSAIRHLLFLQRRLPAFGHIKSHEGQPLNELADSLAKLATKQQRTGTVPPELHWSAEEGVLPWLWVAAGLQREVPRPDAAGRLSDCAAPTVPNSTLTLDDLLPHARPAEAAHIRFHLRVATYNALTVATQLQKESLSSQFSARRIQLIGLQETRSELRGRHRIGAYHVVASPACKGEGGCQVWFAAGRAVGKVGPEEVFWDPASFTVLVEDAQLLLVSARAGGSLFAIIAGHAPTNKAPGHVKERWWEQLDQALRRIPRQALPILCIDANARLAKAPAPHPDNAHFFRERLAAHHFVATPAMATDGQELVSWISPSGLTACIDYICVPAALSQALSDHKILSGFEGQVPHDHKPVQVSISLQQSSRRPTAKPRFHTEFLRTARGRQALVETYATMPHIPWHVGVDEHLDKVNQHLLSALSRICPPGPPTAHSPVISDHTWELVRQRRDLRRELYQRRTEARQRFLRACLRAWHTRQADPPDSRLVDQYTALLVLQLTDLSKAIKTSSKQDAARATQAAFRSARHRGPEALAALLRHVMKTGRKYKPATLAPAIWDEGLGEFVDADRALGDHFAKAERADLSSAAHISAPEMRPLQQDIEPSSAISIPQLSQAFARLAHRKSPGITGIPAEAYSQAPVPAASAHAPLLLKIALRKQMPLLWTGGEVVAISKPQKHPHSVEAWRSIRRAMRPTLLQAFKQLKHPGQGGSVPREPLQWTMAFIRGFARRLRTANTTGAVLFLDGKQAFYSVLRQALVGAEADCPLKALESLADKFFDLPQDRLDFLSAALAPGLLANTEVPPLVRRILAASLQRTWYIHGRATKWIYETHSGTTPGAPLADLHFQFLMSLVFAQVTKRVSEEGIEAWCPSSGLAPGFQMIAPSWMDDWALPIVPPSPDQLLKHTRVMVEIVDRALSGIGIEVNYAAGKTELVPFFFGAGSRKARMAIFQGQDSVQVEVARGQVSVRVVPEYEHLGSIITWDAQDRRDVQHRRLLARTMVKSMRRVLANDFLSERERADLLVSMPLARLRHGAGLWELSTSADRSAYHAAYMEILRRAFRAITQLTSRGRSDDDICTGLGLLNPQQTRIVDLIRHAAWLAACPEPAMAHLWFCDTLWLSQVQRALADMAQILPKANVSLATLRSCPSQAKKWLRQYTLTCRHRQEALRRTLLPGWRGQQLARDKGWLFVHLPPARTCAPPTFKCCICDRHFTTKAASRAHARKVHHVRSEVSLATFGTRCECCSKEFWSEARLKEHFKTHPYCRQCAIESDIDPFEGKTSSERAWKPAVIVPGPKPWWALQGPFQPHVAPEPTMVSGWALMQGILKRGFNVDLYGFVQSTVEVAVQHHLDMEDAPLALLTGPHSALVQCALFAAEAIRRREAGSFGSGPWQVLVSGDRAILIPQGGKKAQVQLPAVWQECFALLP